MKRLKKCNGNLTPSVTTVNGVQKVTCTPKDRKRARMMKRVSRRLKANPMKMKRSPIGMSTAEDPLWNASPRTARATPTMM